MAAIGRRLVEEDGITKPLKEEREMERGSASSCTAFTIILEPVLCSQCITNRESIGLGLGLVLDLLLRFGLASYGPPCNYNQEKILKLNI